MDTAAELLAGVVDHPDVRRQMSRDHFSADGTLIDALRGLLAASLAESDRSPADDSPSGPAGPAPCGNRIEGLLAFDGRR